MNKSKKWARIISGVILCLILLFLYDIGAFVPHSAVWEGNHIYWDNKTYVECYSGDYTEKKTIAKTTDNWKINEIYEDDSLTFIVVRYFLDQYLYVREDYIIPQSGTVTAVSWDNEKITDPSFCDTVSKIYESDGIIYEYETEEIFDVVDNLYMKTLCFAYEDCPVATEFIGYMGRENNIWVITIIILPDTFNADGPKELYKVICKEIPTEYIEELKKYDIIRYEED